MFQFEERNKGELQEQITINIKSEHEEGFKDIIDDDSMSSIDNVNTTQLDTASKVGEFIERFKTELNALTQE